MMVYHDVADLDILENEQRCRELCEFIDQESLTSEFIFRAILDFGVSVEDVKVLIERPGIMWAHNRSYAEPHSYWHRNIKQSLRMNPSQFAAQA